MKKITLLFCILLCYSMNSQVTVWSDNFDDEDITDWTVTDSDGDTNNWGDIAAIGDGMGGFVTPVSLISRSWQTVALTPDNWIISPVIDLSTATTPITLEWITQVAAAAWDEEKYSIHVGTSSDIAVLIGSATSMTVTLGDVGNTGTPTDQTFDISALAGESEVYVAFRHWDCTDQDFISIDDVTVKAQTLSIDEFDAPVGYHISCNGKWVTISNIQGKANYKIISLTGQAVLESSTRLEKQAIDLNNLASGIYIVEVSNADNSKVQRKKIVLQ